MNKSIHTHYYGQSSALRKFCIEKYGVEFCAETGDEQLEDQLDAEGYITIQVNEDYENIYLCKKEDLEKISIVLSR